MKSNSSFAKVVYVLAFIATVIGFTAFSQKPAADSFRKEQPSKGDSSRAAERAFDDDRRFDQLDIQLKHLDLKLDQLNAELKNLDLSKTDQELKRAMKEVYMNRISEQVERSLKKIDWNGMHHEFDKSIVGLNKAEKEEMKRQIEKVKTQVEKQKFDFHFSAPKIDNEKIRSEAGEAMKKARKSIEKAREEMRQMRAFTDALQADGLIDKSKPYKIEVKSGELYLNGVKQSKEINEKYKHFYKKDHFTINMTGDDEWI
jgi:hypothetical protein